MLCCIVTDWGLIFCIFHKYYINSQPKFGAEFRLLADVGNNSSNTKWIKFTTFKTGLRGDPQTDFSPVLWREPALARSAVLASRRKHGAQWVAQGLGAGSCRLACWHSWMCPLHRDCLPSACSSLDRCAFVARRVVWPHLNDNTQLAFMAGMPEPNLAENSLH